MIFEHTIDDLAKLSGREMEHLGRLGTPLFKAKGADRFTPVDSAFAMAYAAKKAQRDSPAAQLFLFLRAFLQ
ncbi:MAG: hypothetical protein MO846_08905 [Candidatus Devosia symbiotica]|nr:hypothetical protein [Candidatus Devosia symbiotica]